MECGPKSVKNYGHFCRTGRERERTFSTKEEFFSINQLEPYQVQVKNPANQKPQYYGLAQTQAAAAGAFCEGTKNYERALELVTNSCFQNISCSPQMLRRAKKKAASQKKRVLSFKGLESGGHWIDCNSSCRSKDVFVELHGGEHCQSTSRHWAIH